jgi:membrane fusion protein, multidrug efflux system
MKTPSRRAVTSLLIASAGIALAIFLFYRLHASAAEPREAPAPRAVPVQVAKVEKRDLPIWLEGLGSVTAWQQVTVRTQVDGRLDQVLFQEGQVVHRGDVLAQIDPRPFEVQLQQAEGALARDRAQLKAAAVDLERFKTLAERKLIAPQQADDQAAVAGQSQGSVQVDQAAIRSARLNIEYARIRAPIDGVVGVRLVDAGNIVHPTDTNGLVIITQLDPAAVLFTVPQDALPRIVAARAKGDVVVEAWSRDGLARLGIGTLTVVDNQINTATSTLKLKARMANPDGQLWPNEFVKARLLVDTKHDALVVPGAAVQRGPQGTFVYVVGADQTAQMQPVEVELVTGDVAVLRRGVAAGDKVVIEGQTQLRPGSRVSIGRRS